MATQEKTQQSKGIFPSSETYERAFKISIRDNKPIHGYFYIPSLKGKICIKYDGEDKIIWASEDEHSSPIVNAYKSGNDLIMVTENTIYIISAKTPVSKD